MMTADNAIDPLMSLEVCTRPADCVATMASMLFIAPKLHRMTQMTLLLSEA